MLNYKTLLLIFICFLISLSLSAQIIERTYEWGKDTSVLGLNLAIDKNEVIVWAYPFPYRDLNGTVYGLVGGSFIGRSLIWIDGIGEVTRRKIYQNLYVKGLYDPLAQIFVNNDQILVSICEQVGSIVCSCCVPTVTSPENKKEGVLIVNNDNGELSDYIVYEPDTICGDVNPYIATTVNSSGLIRFVEKSNKYYLQTVNVETQSKEELLLEDFPTPQNINSPFIPQIDKFIISGENHIYTLDLSGNVEQILINEGWSNKIRKYGFNNQYYVYLSLPGFNESRFKIIDYINNTVLLDTLLGESRYLDIKITEDNKIVLLKQKFLDFRYSISELEIRDLNFELLNSRGIGDKHTFPSGMVLLDNDVYMTGHWYKTDSITNIDFNTRLYFLKMPLDSINDLGNPTNIVQNDLSTLQLYPNPMESTLTIDVPNNFKGDELNLTITDISGREAYTEHSVHFMNPYDLSFLSKGLYFATLHRLSDNMKWTKILVKN